MCARGYHDTGTTKLPLLYVNDLGSIGIPGRWKGSDAEEV